MSTLFYKMTEFPVINLAASCCATPTVTKDDNWCLLSMRVLNIICRKFNIHLPTKETAELFAREYSEKKILSWPNIGRVAIVNIRKWMASYGLYLQDERKGPPNGLDDEYVILEHASDTKCRCGCNILDHRIDAGCTCGKCDCKEFQPVYKRSDYPELVDSGRKEYGRPVINRPDQD